MPKKKNEMADEPIEPGEEDIVTEDYVHYWLGEELFATVPAESTDKEMWAILNAAMAATRYFPNVWHLSDHGNFHLLRMPAEYDTIGRAISKTTMSRN